MGICHLDGFYSAEEIFLKLGYQFDCQQHAVGYVFHLVEAR